jgi:hypothetical protein
MSKSPSPRLKNPDHMFGDPEELLMDRAERARQQWQKEVPEIADKLTPMVVLGRINEASQMMTTDYLTPAYAKIGLKLGEFDVLATLVRSGPPYKLTPDRALPDHHDELRRHDSPARQTGKSRSR